MTSSVPELDPIVVANAIAKGNRCFEMLESLCICFPGRISGSSILEKALDFLLKYGHDNLPSGCCYEEVVDGVPQWIRGSSESCRVAITPNANAPPEPFPLERTFRVLSNGLSVGTGTGAVSGPLVIVTSWENLHEVGSSGQLNGAVVLYDYKVFTDYGTHSQFRGRGAVEAAKYGALAVLIRTITPNSSTSGIHTGQMVYQEDVPENPLRLHVHRRCGAAQSPCCQTACLVCIHIFTLLSASRHSLKEYYI